MPKFSLDWKALEDLKQEVQMHSPDHKDILIDEENHSFVIPLRQKGYRRDKVYDPTGSLMKFHVEREKQVKLIIGPFSSGKSTACCAEILFAAVRMPRMYDGVRRSRWTIIRTTMGQLETTTLKTWMAWFEHLGIIKRTKKPVFTLTHYFTDGNGPIELEIVFLALDREDDRAKLESLEITGAYLNETQHINHAIFTHIQGRLRRFPSLEDVEFGYPGFVLADTNPPDEDHWIYKTFEESNNALFQIFHQPPGLTKDEDGRWISNPDRDNKTHIVEDYYPSMAAGANWDNEYIKVFCCGEYGIVSHGKVVFHEYNDNIHAVDDVPIIENGEVYVFWDYGVTPCALICQTTNGGQLRAIKEFVSERSGVAQLAKLFVLPYLATSFPKFTITSVGDPANPTAQTDLNTCQNVLADLGLVTRPARTNNIEARLNAGRDYLNRLIDGTPSFVLSKSGCPTLRKSLKKEYCFKRIRVVGDEKYEEKPNKTHPWSDIADCFEYAALEFTFQVKNPAKKFDYERFHTRSRF